VSTRAALLSYSNLARWQIDVVHDDQNIERVELIFSQELFDGKAASIHEGLRHRQSKRASFPFSPGDSGLSFRLERLPDFFADCLNDLEPNIVPRPFVFDPGISQADYYALGGGHDLWVCFAGSTVLN